MLNFIYTDMISDNAVHQHLLVAADRFGLDRLRLTCEFLLCRGLDGDNVSSTLALAEQHNCRQLKAACMKYMASEKILKAVMATNGCQLLASSCPSLVEKMKASCREKTRNASPFNATILSLCVLWIVFMYFYFPLKTNCMYESNHHHINYDSKERQDLTIDSIIHAVQ
jgi:BTB/POZ domain